MYETMKVFYDLFDDFGDTWTLLQNWLFTEITVPTGLFSSYTTTPIEMLVGIGFITILGWGVASWIIDILP
jgi:hypothetical protein